jgi:hypothetical protein
MTENELTLTTPTSVFAGDRTVTTCNDRKGDAVTDVDRWRSA